MNANELKNNQRELNNSRDIIKDICQGDLSALDALDEKNLDMTAIKTAINFLVNNPSLSEQDKADLLHESWRVNYRAKPPTPEEFITEKYLGPTANSTYQRVKDVFVDFMDPTKPYRDLILYPHIGWGKGLQYKELLYTPNGPIHVEDAQIGDELCTPDGKLSHISNKQEWPDAPIYEIEFSDHRKVKVFGEHYWKAAYSYNSSKWNPVAKKYDIVDRTPCWKIITTEKLLEDMKAHPNHKWFIPIAKPVFHKEREHLIPSYSLGALLGDGCLVTGSLGISNDDSEVIDRVKEEFKKSNLDTTFNIREKAEASTRYYLRLKGDKIRPELQRLGLLNSKSATKFIPEEYKYDSIENRIALLQGLLDTDGNVESKQHYPRASFWSISEQLVDDVMEVSYGLGACKCAKHSSTGKNGVKNFSVTITFPSNEFPLFTLERKQKYIDREYSKDKKGWKKQRKPQVLHISSIKSTEEKGGVCIETDDAEHLFLTNNYIVTHNSYLSTIITLYISTCVTLMRQPFKFFGLAPATQFSQFLMSYNLKKASELLLEPFNSILEASPFFEKVNRRETMQARERDFAHMETVDKIYYTTAYPTSALGFSSGLTIKLASSPTAILGCTIISAVLSELAFFTDAGKTSEYIMRIYNDTKQRIDSRMFGGYWGRSILDSSPNDMNNAIDYYINTEAPNRATNKIVRGSMWEWSDRWDGEFERGETFSIYTGGKGNPPRLLSPNDPLLEPGAAVDPTKIIKVPNSMRTAFEDDLVKSIKDRCGIPAGSSNSLINDYDIIERMFNNKLKNVYTCITAPSTMNPSNLIWDQIRKTFFKQKGGVYEYYYKPQLPRCVSVDQSLVNDLTCIACSHAERFFDSGELIYVIDFTIVINPDGGKVNLDAIRCFIEDLRNKGHLNIEHVSFDQFQSEAAIQYLKRVKFEVERLSVDRSMDPYLNMVSLMNTNRIACGKNIFLKNNIKSLNVIQPKSAKGKMKIDHDNSRGQVIEGNTKWETSQLGYFGKDTSDAVAASIELNRLYYPVVDAQWDGGPKAETLSPEHERKEAARNVKLFMSSMGIGY